MRLNLPLLYEQLRAGIRNEVDGLARRLKPLVFMRTGKVIEHDSMAFQKERKINEQKNHRRNSNFRKFRSFLAGISAKRRLPNSMPAKI